MSVCNLDISPPIAASSRGSGNEVSAAANEPDAGFETIAAPFACFDSAGFSSKGYDLLGRPLRFLRMSKKTMHAAIRAPAIAQPIPTPAVAPLERLFEEDLRVADPLDVDVEEAWLPTAALEAPDRAVGVADTAEVADAPLEGLAWLLEILEALVLVGSPLVVVELLASLRCWVEPSIKTLGSLPFEGGNTDIVCSFPLGAGTNITAVVRSNLSVCDEIIIMLAVGSFV